MDKIAPLTDSELAQLQQRGAAATHPEAFETGDGLRMLATIAFLQSKVAALRAQVTALREVVELYPEFEDDLDETACATGFVTCPICEGGGYLLGRRFGYELRGKKPLAQHKPGCKRVAALAGSAPNTEA